MIWWLALSLASAGNIYVDSGKPVMVKVEGELVRKEPATRVIVPDLSEATYRVEITDLFGKTLAFKEVDVGWDKDVHLEFEDGYLDVVRPPADTVYAERTGVPLLPLETATKLERKLVKGSVKKKLKYLDEFTVGYGLTMQQIDKVLNGFHKREDRLAALTMVLDRVTEPDKYKALDHHFAVKSDREKMQALFEAVLAAEAQ